MFVLGQKKQKWYFGQTNPRTTNLKLGIYTQLDSGSNMDRVKQFRQFCNYIQEKPHKGGFSPSIIKGPKSHLVAAVGLSLKNLISTRKNLS